MRLAILAAAIVLASPAAAEPLYNGQNAGAPESAVLPTFPTAKLESDKDGVRLWRAEDAPFEDMWTILEFANGGLARVTMYGRGGDRFVEVKDYLRKRYGAPSVEGFAADSGVAIWQVGTTRIAARLTPSYRSMVGDVTEPFTVTYTSSAERPSVPF